MHAVDGLVRGKDRPILEALEQLVLKAEAESVSASHDNILEAEAAYLGVRNGLIADPRAGRHGGGRGPDGVCQITRQPSRWPHRSGSRVLV